MFEFAAALAHELTPRDRARHLKAVRELSDKARIARAKIVALKVEMIAQGRTALVRAFTALEDQNLALAQECVFLERALS